MLYIGDSPQMIAIYPSRVDARTLGEAIALAKASPGRFAYGHCGPGSTHHLAMELLKVRTGANIREVAYRGCSLAVTDAVSGQLDFVVASSPAVLPHVRSGKLRGLAVTRNKRSAAAPDIPTMGEVIGQPDAAIGNWYALIAVRGTPREAMARVEAAVRDAVARPDVIDRLAGAGIDLAVGGPDVLREAIAQDVRNFRPVIDASGIKIE